MYVIFNLQYKFLLFAPLARLYVGIPDRSFFLQFVFFAAYFLRYFKGCMVFATSLNRCTAVIAYISHERIWKYAFPISLFCSFTIALSLTWFYFFGRIVLIPMDIHMVTYGLGPKPDFFSAYSAIKLALFGLFCGSLDFIVNAITCTMIFLKRRQNTVFNKIILGLMIITLIEFATQMLVFVGEGALVILGKNFIFDGIYNDFYFAMCWITDLSTLLKPYTLLIISGTVRKCFLESYWETMKTKMLLKTLSYRISGIW